MQEQFLDRILSCVDCHGEFIFTAGEQLFFSDKQFKNDPKRCKPCKSRRSGLAAVANGTGPVPAGLSRTETRTHCSECGIETTVPFKPTQGRPVLCRQCFQLKNRAAAPAILPTAGLEASSPALTVTPSSVATPADLAYVASLAMAPPSVVPAGAQATARLTAQIIACAPAELHAPATAPAPELQTIAAEALQA